MILTKQIAKATGLPISERAMLERLVDTLNRNEAGNQTKRRFYEGHIWLSEVNLGLALPKNMGGLEYACSWGRKAVDTLASHSMFDGFVSAHGDEAETMTRLMQANNLRAEYDKACRDELTFGCAFATLSRDRAIGCRIRFHSPETATAEWDGVKGRIGAGLAIAATVKDRIKKESVPGLVYYYTDHAVWELQRGDNDWTWYAKRHPNAMGRPLMEPFVWDATSDKRFGRGRLKKPIRDLIKGYVRTMVNASVALEFATAPQKYLLGLTEDQYETITSQQFRNYVGGILASTTNPETGQNPTFGQLAQGNLEPHVAEMRLLATQFSAATGLTVADVGVINDANPSSADAIAAQNRTMVLMAERLNASNAASLHTVALMAQAIARNVKLEALTEEERDVMAHFRNPSMPSVAVTADAAVKLATSRPSFGGTDVFLEMSGFDQADIRRIKAQEARARGLQLLTKEFGDDDQQE